MFLSSLRLYQFKNYESFGAEFCPDVNIIVGKNGAGKTNILDAIYYLALTKSYFHSTDLPSIQHEKNLFTIKGIFSSPLTPKGGTDTIEDTKGLNFNIFLGIEKNQKKILRFDEVPYTKINEHIGKIPVVMIAPADDTWLHAGSEARRKFFDGILAQIDNLYLGYLLRYNHFLTQRNSLLKQCEGRTNRIDLTLLEQYDEELLYLCDKIFEKRTAFLEIFIPIFLEYYDFIAGNSTENTESPALSYVSQVAQEDFKQQFKNSLTVDIFKQRTSFGIHKDDFEGLLNGYSVRKFGSQGQQKSFLLALKIAQFFVIQQQKGFSPILLLDDIFDKLDDFRMQKLLEILQNPIIGQTFITDARPERSQHLFKNFIKKYQFLEL